MYARLCLSHRRMISAFGSGAAFSMVSGMASGNKLQGAFTTGTLFALFQGAFFVVSSIPCASICTNALLKDTPVIRRNKPYRLYMPCSIFSPIRATQISIGYEPMHATPLVLQDTQLTAGQTLRHVML